jgi:hypothetical protein
MVEMFEDNKEGKIRSRMNLFMANLACAGKYEVQLLAFELIPGF